MASVRSGVGRKPVGICDEYSHAVPVGIRQGAPVLSSRDQLTGLCPATVDHVGRVLNPGQWGTVVDEFREPGFLSTSRIR